MRSRPFKKETVAKKVAKASYILGTTLLKVFVKGNDNHFKF